MNLKKVMMLSCLICFVLITGWRLSRVPAPREAETPADLRPAVGEPTSTPASASAPEHRTFARRLWLRSFRPEPLLDQQASVQQLIPAEPPDDPDEGRQWARENPDLALAWMIDAPAGPQRDTIAEIVCAQVAESDPARAVALAEQYAGSCTNLLENLLLQWSERDEAAALSYALAKASGDERDRLLARVALTRAKKDPVGAATLVVQEMAPGETQNEAAISVVHQWALRSPDEALAWVQLFPEGELRTRALNEIKNLQNLLRQPGNGQTAETVR